MGNDTFAFISTGSLFSESGFINLSVFFVGYHPNKSELNNYHPIMDNFICTTLADWVRTQIKIGVPVGYANKFSAQTGYAN